MNINTYAIEMLMLERRAEIELAASANAWQHIIENMSYAQLFFENHKIRKKNT